MLKSPQEHLNAEAMRREAIARLDRLIIVALIILFTILGAAIGWPLVTGFDLH